MTQVIVWEITVDHDPCSNETYWKWLHYFESHRALQASNQQSDKEKTCIRQWQWTWKRRHSWPHQQIIYNRKSRSCSLPVKFCFGSECSRRNANIVYIAVMSCDHLTYILMIYMFCAVLSWVMWIVLTKLFCVSGCQATSALVHQGFKGSQGMFILEGAKQACRSGLCRDMHQNQYSEGRPKVFCVWRLGLHLYGWESSLMSENCHWKIWFYPFGLAHYGTMAPI